MNPPPVVSAGRAPRTGRCWAPSAAVALTAVVAGGCGSGAVARTNVARADVFSVRVDGSDLRNLTQTPRRWESQVSVSPDGSHIAFVRSGLPDRGGRLVVVDADGEGARDLGPAALSPDAAAPPAWSPDGRALAFTNSVACDEVVCGTWEVWVVDVASRRRRRITRHGMSPSWSPDGRRLVYGGNLGTGWTVKGYFTFATDVVIQDLGSGRARTLGRGATPLWAPHGDWIAYVGNDGEQHRLRVVRSDGSDRRTVGTAANAPRWTRDARLVFVSMPPDRDAATVVSSSPPGGRRRTRLLAGDFSGAFAVSSDHRRAAWTRFVYSRQESRSHDDLLVGPIDRSRGRVVVAGDPGTRIGNVVWTRRGRIVFSAWRVS